ncbi:MAG: helix-turn-helix domain-containing protein [Kiritimatiellae bacterium]|nr:helix-turn-helix domain-containing protein [Kiritimatiellia bacterium]
MALGNILRKAREARGLTLTDIATETHILLRYLENIEQEKFKHIPAEIYGCGFVSKYAKFMGLDEEPLLEDFSRIWEQTHDASGRYRPPNPVEQPPPPVEEPQTVQERAPVAPAAAPQPAAKQEEPKTVAAQKPSAPAEPVALEEPTKPPAKAQPEEPPVVSILNKPRNDLASSDLPLFATDLTAPAPQVQPKPQPKAEEPPQVQPPLKPRVTAPPYIPPPRSTNSGAFTSKWAEPPADDAEANSGESIISKITRFSHSLFGKSSGWTRGMRESGRPAWAVGAIALGIVVVLWGMFALCRNLYSETTDLDGKPMHEVASHYEKGGLQPPGDTDAAAQTAKAETAEPAVEAQKKILRSTGGENVGLYYDGVL